MIYACPGSGKTTLNARTKGFLGYSINSSDWLYYWPALNDQGTYITNMPHLIRYAKRSCAVIPPKSSDQTKQKKMLASKSPDPPKELKPAEATEKNSETPLPQKKIAGTYAEAAKSPKKGLTPRLRVVHFGRKTLLMRPVVVLLCRRPGRQKVARGGEGHWVS